MQQLKSEKEEINFFEIHEAKANKIANELRIKHGKNLKKAEGALNDRIYDLFDKSEPHFLKDFLLQVSCLFTDPEISGKLPAYLKGSSPKYFHSLLEFLVDMDSEFEYIHPYLLIYGLENFPNNFTEEQLSNIKKYQLND